MKCKGLKANGYPCKSNFALENGFCAAHQNQFTPIPIPDPVIIPEIFTTTLTPENRVLAHRKNPPCPKCGSHPTVCMSKDINSMVRRCRVCGHRFEVKR